MKEVLGEGREGEECPAVRIHFPAAATQYEPPPLSDADSAGFSIRYAGRL